VHRRISRTPRPFLSVQLRRQWRRKRQSSPRRESIRIKEEIREVRRRLAAATSLPRLAKRSPRGRRRRVRPKKVVMEEATT
ncbi:hypothetical protein PMAYCL1PPCAC_28634, partial [Pristionchus mayeri]